MLRRTPSLDRYLSTVAEAAGLSWGNGLGGFKRLTGNKHEENQELNFAPATHKIFVRFSEAPARKALLEPADFSFCALEPRKELAMASRNKTHPCAANEERDRKPMQRCMNTLIDRQLDAYLSAREAIRRIKRTSTLFSPAYAGRSGSLRTSSD